MTSAIKMTGDRGKGPSTHGEKKIICWEKHKRNETLQRLKSKGHAWKKDFSMCLIHFGAKKGEEMPATLFSTVEQISSNLFRFFLLKIAIFEYSRAFLKSIFGVSQEHKRSKFFWANCILWIYAFYGLLCRALVYVIKSQSCMNFLNIGRLFLCNL